MTSITQKILVATAMLAIILSLVTMFSMRSIVKRTLNCSVCHLAMKYYQEVSPCGMTHKIAWPIIYAWNLLSMIYICVSLFLPGNKSPIKFTPSLVPCRFLVGFTVVFACKITFLLTYIMENLWLTFTFMAVSASTAWYVTGLLHKLVHENAKELEAKNKGMLRILRWLVLNGLGILSTWLTFSCSAKLARVIIYESSYNEPMAARRGISVEDGSTMVLVGILVVVMIWFAVENFVWEKYLRYTFTVYPALILGYAGIVVKLHASHSLCHCCHAGSQQNRILAAIILAICSMSFILRLGLFFCRRKRGFDKAAITEKHIEAL